MKPFLAYGWQPQVMAIEGQTKAILAGRLEAYDVVADPEEARDLGETASLPRPLRTALREYPAPSLEPPKASESVSDEDRRKLASLGYVSAGAAPVVRHDAPRPADMARLFDVLEQSSALFVREQYARVIPLLERVLARTLQPRCRAATGHRAVVARPRNPGPLGFQRRGRSPPAPGASAPTCAALRARPGLATRGAPAQSGSWPRRTIPARRHPWLWPATAGTPRGRRRPAAEDLRPAHADAGGACAAGPVRDEPRAHAARPGVVREGASGAGRRRFRADLELGVLYLAARRFEEARDALDRVPPSHPQYPMALFKRAQVSVLLNEPDQGARIEAARRHADSATPAADRERTALPACPNALGRPSRSTGCLRVSRSERTLAGPAWRAEGLAEGEGFEPPKACARELSRLLPYR